MNLINRKNLFILSLLILLIQGCKMKDDLDKLTNPDWRPDLAIPLISSKITVSEVFDRFKEDSIIIEDGEGFVILVYRGNIYSNKGEQVFTMPNLPITSSQVNLPQLIGSRSLGQIANAISDPEKTLILSAHGTTSNLPAIPQQAIGSFSINGNNQSSTFTFESGSLIMNVENNFPFDITNLNIELVDSLTGTPVASYNFTLIPAGQTRSSSSDLTGKSLSSSMQISMPSISSNTTPAPVSVDTAAQMIISFDGQDLVFEVVRDTISLGLTNGERLDHLRLNSGVIRYDGSSTIGGNATLEVKLENMSGPPFNFPLNSITPESLDGREFDFTGGGMSGNKMIGVVKFNGSGETISFSSGHTINLNIQIRNLSVGYADGYLGNQVFDLKNDTIDIQIYGNFYDGAIKFLDPQIKIIVRSSYGFPITSKFNLFLAYNQQTKNSMVITTPFDSLLFNYPSMAQIGEFATTTTLINQSNSNILTVMDLPPTDIRYGLNVVSNTEKDTTQMNFILDTSHFEIDVDVQLPLQGRISGLSIQDTISIETEVLENADYVNFVVVTENRFPLDVRMQVYFLDDADILLDSLMSPAKTLFVSAKIDGDGAVVSATKKVTYIPCQGAKYERVKKARKVIVKAMMATTDNGGPIVKIYSTNFFDLKIGIEARFHPKL